MPDPSRTVEQRQREASEALGAIVAEFKEETAGVPRLIGRILALLGVLLLAARLLFDLHEFLLILGILWIALGLLLIAVGRSLTNNRLLVHAHGLAQFRGGEYEATLWKDVHNILVDEHRRYASGLAHSVHYYCKLERHDGGVTRLDAVTITPRILQLIRERWEMTTETNRKC